MLNMNNLMQGSLTWIFIVVIPIHRNVDITDVKRADGSI